MALVVPRRISTAHGSRLRVEEVGASASWSVHWLISASVAQPPLPAARPILQACLPTSSTACPARSGPCICDSAGHGPACRAGHSWMQPGPWAAVVGPLLSGFANTPHRVCFDPAPCCPHHRIPWSCTTSCLAASAAPSCRTAAAGGRAALLRAAGPRCWPLWPRSRPQPRRVLSELQRPCEGRGPCTRPHGCMALWAYPRSRQRWAQLTPSRRRLPGQLNPPFPAAAAAREPLSGCPGCSAGAAWCSGGLRGVRSPPAAASHFLDCHRLHLRSFPLSSHSVFPVLSV